MTEHMKLAVELRELAARYPNILLKLPHNPVGLPEGEFNLSTFLRYLANSVIGKPSYYQKGSPRDIRHS